MKYVKNRRLSKNTSKWLNVEISNVRKRDELVSVHRLIHELTLGENQKGYMTKLQTFECDIVEAMRTGIFVCGTSNSGKSNLGFVIADLLLRNDVIVYVIDPSQVWEKSSLPNAIRIKYPMKVKWKDGTVAQSTVFDISFLSYQERLEFTEKFCKILLDSRKKSNHRPPTFVFFEEGQLYFHAGTMKSLKRFSNAIELVTNGRNFKVRYGIITQFPTMIDRLLIKMTKQRYFGWTNEPDDIRYIASIIGMEMAKELSRLDIGEFIYSYAVRNGYVKKVQVPFFENKSYVFQCFA